MEKKRTFKTISLVLTLVVLSLLAICLAVCFADAEYTYGDPLWSWASDYSWATATFVSTNGEDTQTLSAVVTSNTEATTCTTDGQTIYTATVTFNDADYTDVRTVTIDATGHNYGDPVWNWAGDYSSATASFTCKDGDDTQTVTATVTSNTTNATCTTDGEIVYTAVATFNSVDYTDTQTVTIKATGHSYGDPVWNWAGDYSSATASFTCKDGDDTQTVNATVTSESTAASCTADGKTVYTATATFNSVDYTDTQTVVISATGHSYGDPVWNWAEDYSTATVSFACKDGDDTQTVNAIVTSNTTNATCTTDGQTVYTAVATFNSVDYTDTQTVTIQATGHSYTALTYSDGYWYETCTVCGDVLSTTYEGTDYSNYTFLVGDTTSAAAAIALNATNIQLTADVTVSIDDLTSTFTSTNEVNMTIDVAGHTLTVEEGNSLYTFNLYNGQSLTITDSAYDSSSETPGLVLNNTQGLSASYACVCPRTGCTFTLDSIYVTSYGCTIYPRGDAAGVNVINSKVITYGGYVISTNAATVSNYNVVITVDGSHLETQASGGDSAVILINVAGTLNISDSTIIGQRQGVIVRAGTATMSNTTVACTMYESYLASNMTNRTTYTTAWGGGNEVAMGAVVVGNDTESTYAANATLSMTDCELSYSILDADGNSSTEYSDYAVALYLLRLNNDTYNTSVALSGTNTLTGYVINYSNTATLSGYDGTVYNTYSSGWVN